jgi:hypothetical protein
MSSESSCRRVSLAPLAALAFLGLAGSGCSILFPEQCPDLDEVCPDVQCDDYKQNRDGCSICECADDTAPTICWDDSECGSGQRCDSVNFCEQAPGCDGDGPCPDACYGRCVGAPSPCAADGDCPQGQICAFFDNARPAPADGADVVAPAPDGVCIDAGCEDRSVDLPTCPPGFELGFDPNIDACNLVCLPVDPCRELLPEECGSKPGCQLIEEGCGCSGDACDCANIERCVSIVDCSRLPVEACQLEPNCILVPLNPNAGSGGGSDQPVPCIPEDPNCGAAPPPPSDLVCVPRTSTGECRTDADCLGGEICQPTTVCGSGCTVDANGVETCFDQCWTEGGVCVPSSTSCFALDPQSCAADARCILDADGTCRPAESTSCFSDAECLAGQHCDVIESCPPCDPSTNDLACAQPCFVDGRCVDGPPPPTSCNVDTDCSAGEACVLVTVCETCPAQPAPGGGVAPPPCDPVCFDQGVCAAAERKCFSDTDCGSDELCDFSNTGCRPGSNLVACQGTCAPLPAPGLCQDDTQCGPNQRCATELDLCAQNPVAPDTGCWTVCVDVEPAAGTYCLDDGACSAGERCAFNANVCLDDPSTDLAVCSGWCAGACAEVETPAHDPATAQCVVFPDTCIPPGWVTGC